MKTLDLTGLLYMDFNSAALVIDFDHFRFDECDDITTFFNILFHFIINRICFNTRWN